MQLDMLTAAAPAQRAAKVRASDAMERVSDAVEAESPGWSAKALDAVKRFAAAQAGLFTTEAMRGVIESELPPTNRLRVWGPITKTARAKGYIEQVKGAYAPAASSNGSPKPLYKRGPNV